jgi:phosphatidylglycerophosphate synthase
LITALWLLAIQGTLGAFDTLYYHEWRARLPAGGETTRDELRLHAARDFIYTVVFASLPWVAWRGAWSLMLSALLLAEIFITLRDFVVEDRVRKSLGGVYAGERVTHALMGIIYGAFLAFLLPSLLGWWRAPTSLAPTVEAVPRVLRWALVVMAVGVFLSGVRDLAAALGLPHGGWPWRDFESK